MKYDEAKEQFIESWGSLGSKWGINKTMARIHALLLITPNPLSTEEIMETLQISRGNVNMNIRTLIDWGLVYKKIISGERKDFYLGEKDAMKVTRRVIRIRRQQELRPMLAVLDELSDFTPESNDDNELQFSKSIHDISKFALQADATLEKIEKSEENWFWNTFLKLI
jgi:DNA-binding transcriptional regulator GbsR (MarR family)